MTNDALAGYFARIGYTGEAEPTLDTLRQMIWLHQHVIPFENLDIALFHRPISLAPEAIYAKLVGNRRGGFCFEHNGLLAAMLEQLGFSVTMGYATWTNEAGVEIVPFDHLVLRVTIPGDDVRWLADVGFGSDTPPGPLRLIPGQEQHHAETGTTYRALAHAGPNRQWAIQHRRGDGAWRQLYDIDFTPRTMADFEGRSLFNQTSPESHFTQGTMCSRPRAGGRVTVARGTLIVTSDGQREETPLDGPEAEWAALREWFGIEREGEIQQ